LGGKILSGGRASIRERKRMRKEYFMKNTIKVLGVIAIVAVIGFSLSGCKEEEEETAKEGDAFLKVVNQYNRPITSVAVGTSFNSFWFNLNITTGNSETFTVKWEDYEWEYKNGGTLQVVVKYGSGSSERGVKYVSFKPGETITVILPASHTDNGYLQ
jgi:hypothetical protein